ncbi:MAG: sensor histidine kinase [Gallionellaceae bacterium]|nr:sensor histidine kinase [Gallionellaceae bacterium]
MSGSLARGSLRLRLLLGTLTWIALTIVAAGWGLGSLFRQHVEAQFHAELGTHLDQLTAQLAFDGQGRPMLAAPLSDPRLERPFSGLYWQVDRVGGPAATLRSRSLWDEVLAVPPELPADGQVHRHRGPGPQGTTVGMVERSVAVDGGVWRLVVAADERLMVEPVERFAGALWLALGLLGAGLALAALLQVWLGLAPLQRLRVALGRVREGEVQRLEGSFPAEVMPLVDEFNSVLGQNAAVVERARTQAGNLAHALKTPLSVLANAAAGHDDAFARQVADQVELARRQVDYHLARAQAAAAARLPGVRTPLGPVLNGLVRAMTRIHAGRGLAIRVQPPAPGLLFRGEEQDLQEMLGNLVDNACKWAAGRVEVAASGGQDGIELTVDDDGPGIAPALREAMLRRGVRADERVPGSGLGLAIVDDLAQLYGGSVRLADSPLGGTRAILALPGAVTPGSPPAPA